MWLIDLFPRFSISRTNLDMIGCTLSLITFCDSELVLYFGSYCYIAVSTNITFEHMLCKQITRLLSNVSLIIQLLHLFYRQTGKQRKVQS